MFDLDPHKKKVNFAHNHIFQVIPREQKCICKNRELHKLSIHTTFQKSFDPQWISLYKQIREVHKRNINNLETIYKQHSKTKSCTVQYFEFHSIILYKFIIFHNHFIDCLYNTFIAWSLFITITSH